MTIYDNEKSIEGLINQAHQRIAELEIILSTEALQLSKKRILNSTAIRIMDMLQQYDRMERAPSIEMKRRLERVTKTEEMPWPQLRSAQPL